MTVAARARAGLALLGPAFVAAIAYVDPGNVATDGQAGAEFGYLLVWVVVAANVMAGLVQYLSAKLGVVTGSTLPALLGDRLGGPARLAFWAQAELVAMITDLAEVLGGAIALHILFGLPLPLGGVLTGLVSTALLAVQSRSGQRPFERVVTALLAVIAVGFLAGLVVRPPSASATAAGLLPHFAGGDSVLAAAGVLGATVMPHVIYLHSALVGDRFGRRSDPVRVLRATRVDIGVAMTIAGGVNLAMLLLAATSLRGAQGAGSIEGVHEALGGALGGTVAGLFAVGLLASGLASTAVGGYAGSVVMAGLLHRRVPVLARRLVTLAPALALLAFGVDPDRALTLSQVVLSCGIPFALVPLVVLTGRRAVMGDQVNGPVLTTCATVVAGGVVALNLALVWLTFTR
ncbi:Nramp family divalent metal transporter [Kutzneria viridogrisea]|uniref:Manganese transport protein n=2 Tax=Kutzneria TaxID=43356 RepID=A0ABR6BWE9_9PSEU|nr:Nramp family divalent metal transporter [Kutzneria albida]AHH94058.1 putative manganese transport protein mntH [Kutzneria albida DSM 43870]MBA8930936.1 manganese transport protein [Kutzneria viridogrisea]